MTADKVCDTSTNVIVITEDYIYSNLVRSRLAMARGVFRVEQIIPNERLTANLEATLGAAGQQSPTLVILDVDSVEANCERLATRTVAKQGGGAKRRVITRAAFDESVARRLRALDDAWRA